MERLRGSIVRVSDTDPYLCPGTNSAVNFQGVFGSAQHTAHLQCSLQVTASPIHTSHEHKKGRSDPSLCPFGRSLLYGSLARKSNQCFTTSFSATSSIVGRQKAFSWHVMLGDRRHLFCQSLWNDGLSSREKIFFRAAEFAGISKCQLTEQESSRTLGEDGSYFCLS